QDVEFDREYGLHSVPQRFGVGAALVASAWSHAATLAFFAAVGLLLHLGWLYWAGWLVAAGLIVYEHRVVSPTDLSRLNVAFFNINSYVAIVLFVFTVAGVAQAR